MSSPPVSSSDDPWSPELDFTATSLDYRKAVARDIVSSFDQDVLPSEFRPEVDIRITDEQGQRPSSEWTMITDLAGTIMTWAVHDTTCWDLMNRCRPPKVRALLYEQKLRRRFHQEFQRYDGMVNPLAHSSDTQYLSPPHVGFTIDQVAHNIHLLAASARLDLNYRWVGRGGVAQVLLEALEAILMTSGSRPLLQPGGRRSNLGAGLGMSLFDLFIWQAPGETWAVILDALETVFVSSPGAFSAMSIQVQTIDHLLTNTDSPLECRARFRQLSAQAGVTE